MKKGNIYSGRDMKHSETLTLRKQKIENCLVETWHSQKKITLRKGQYKFYWQLFEKYVPRMCVKLAEGLIAHISGLYLWLTPSQLKFALLGPEVQTDL